MVILLLGMGFLSIRQMSHASQMDNTITAVRNGTAEKNTHAKYGAEM